MGRRLSILELRSVWGTGGGPEKTILLGADRRDRARFDVTVCYLRHAGDERFAIDARARHLDIDYVELTERGAVDPRVWSGLVRLIRERRIDILHAHDYKTNLLAWLLARRAGVRPLATAHGWTGQSTRERRLYYPFDQWLLARYPHVIAVSSEIRDALLRRGASPARVTVLLNGIDAAAFRRRAGQRDTARAAFGWSPEDFVIGAVGRLERQKRFDQLLNAFAEALRAEPHLRLVLAGDGSLSDELRRLAAALGIDARVELLGHREDVVALHHGLDLLVQSSEYEGTPNAVLEAMAMETPIVATDAGGTAELAVPNVHALIVPVHDSGALARAMLEVKRDPTAARRRASAARERVEHDLSFDARTRRLEQLYLTLMGSSAATRALPLSFPFPDA